MDFRYLSFTHAAKRLHTVQPSLSRQIRQLEQIVGTPLLQRDKRDVKLTEAGRVFLEKARAMLRDLDDAIALARRAARDEAGQITIGFAPGTEARLFIVLLPALRQKFPEMRPTFRALSDPDMIAGLKNHSLNVAFLAADDIDEHPEIVSEIVFRQPLVAVLPARHPLARLRRIPVAKLAAVPLVSPAASSAPTLRKVIQQVAVRHGVAFVSAIDMDNILATLNAIGSGMGFTLLPQYQRHILPDNVVMRPLADDPPPFLDLRMAYRKDDRLPALAFFLGLVRECLQENRQP